MSSSDTQPERAHWTPPEGFDWGEGTHEAFAQAGKDPDERPEWHTDVYEIRAADKLFKQTPSPFEPDFDDIRWELFADVLIHEKPSERTASAGGTDFLRLGERGSGKTTDSRHLAHRLMDANGDKGEKVAWRGDSGRSGWVDYREWTTLWLPEHATVEASWQSEHAGIDPEPVPIEDVARHVRRYSDPRDLVNRLGTEPGGTFHVIYPDPSFAGCSELTKLTDRVPETLPFTPAWTTVGEESATPLTHWWYAFFLAVVEFRDADYWLSAIFDEAGDLTPQDASEDDHKTYSKLNLLRSLYADSRKFRLSIYWSAHYEENLHSKIRREVEHWISMPDGNPNPIQGKSSTYPLGCKKVGMYGDLIGGRKKGTGLLYESGSLFSLYNWDDVTRRGEDDRWLRIGLGEPEFDDEEDSGPTFEYDRSIFKSWRGGDEFRLYVRDPGSGYLDAHTGAEVEPLESPREELQFTGIVETDGERLVSMRKQGSEQDIVVARIPIREIGLESGAAGGSA